jgi:hypothetical protein
MLVIAVLRSLFVGAARKLKAKVDALMMRLGDTTHKKGYFHETSDSIGCGDWRPFGRSAVTRTSQDDA